MPDLLDLDPYNYAWHQIDPDFLQRMSARKYLSMTIERKYNLPVEPGLFLQSDSRTSFNFGPELAMGRESFEFLLDYVTHPDDARTSVENCSSAFEAGMPGVMPLKEVNEQALGRWRIKLGTVTNILKVSSQRLLCHTSTMADDSAESVGPRALGNE